MLWKRSNIGALIIRIGFGGDANFKAGLGFPVPNQDQIMSVSVMHELEARIQSNRKRIVNHMMTIDEALQARDIWAR